MSASPHRMRLNVAELVAQVERYAQLSLSEAGPEPRIRVSPANALPPDVQAQLISRKPEVVAYLQRRRTDARRVLVGDVMAVLARVNALLPNGWPAGCFERLLSTAPHLARRFEIAEERLSDVGRSQGAGLTTDATEAKWRAALDEYRHVLRDIAHELPRSSS